MIKSETTSFRETLTQSTPFGLEVKVGKVSTQHNIGTGSAPGIGSIPSVLPEPIKDNQEGYVFRLANAQPIGSVTITINTKRLIERARVRKLNESIRRARRR